MASDTPSDVVRRFYAEAATANLDDLPIAADIRYHGPALLGDMEGRDAFLGVLNTFRSAFPNFATDVDILVSEGDLVAAWHTHRCVHNGDFAGIPATGQPVVARGLELFRIRDGQIAEFWHMDDLAGVMQQITSPVPTTHEHSSGSSR